MSTARIAGHDADLQRLAVELAAIRALLERQTEQIELLAQHLARLDRSTITMEQLARVPTACMPSGAWPEEGEP